MIKGAITNWVIANTFINNQFNEEKIQPVTKKQTQDPSEIKQRPDIFRLNIFIQGKLDTC